MQLVTNILLGALILMFAGAGALVVLVYRRFTRTVADFLTPPAEGKPSPLALSVDAAAGMIGRSVAAQVKTTLMGMRSGEVRAENAVQGAMALDAAESAGLGSILQASPNLRRTLKRNPGLLDLALPLVSNLFNGTKAGAGASQEGSKNNGAAPRFRL